MKAPIKIFHHSFTWKSGEHDIMKEQVGMMEDSGLFDASEVNIMMHFEESEFEWLRERWSGCNNVNYHLFDESYRQWCEATTILSIQEFCHSTTDEYYILYVMPKGITHNARSEKDDLEQVNWRYYLNYWNILKWKDCVEKLDEGYDLVGAGYIWPHPGHYHSINGRPHNPIFAGNMWWGKASYFRRCVRLKPPSEVGYRPQVSACDHHRYDWEFWHGTGDPNTYDLNPSSDPNNPGAQDWRWTFDPKTYNKDYK